MQNRQRGSILLVKCTPFLWNTLKDLSTCTISEKCEVRFEHYQLRNQHLGVCERTIDQSTITNKSIPD
jgi:hypothetical protein